MSDVSVVITVKNDPRVLDCVDAILHQDVDFAFDVLVVDNGSTDDTAARLRERYGKDARVRILESPGNLSAAWNAAAQSASARVLARIDADAVPLDGWLASLVAPLLAGTRDWTAGPVEGVNPDGNVVERYFHWRTETYCHRLAEDEDLRDAVPSWNVAYTRDALDKAGWYDPWQASSVDWDLHKRLRLTGARGVFVPEARARHHHPRSLRAFARKEAWYKTGHYQMTLKYGIRETYPAYVLPATYGGVLALLAAGAVVRPLAWLGGGLLVVVILRHWWAAIKEKDPVWYYRAVFRPVEAAAGIWGTIRGIARYGFRRRPVNVGKV